MVRDLAPDVVIQLIPRLFFSRFIACSGLQRTLTPPPRAASIDRAG